MDGLSPADPAALLNPYLQQELDSLERQAASILSRPVSSRQPEIRRPNRRRFLVIAAGIGAAAVSVSVFVRFGSGDHKTALSGDTESGTAVTPAQALPPAPAPLWTRSPDQILSFTNSRLARMDNTVVWWHEDSAFAFDAATGTSLWTMVPTYPDLVSFSTLWFGVYEKVLYGTAAEHLVGYDPKGGQH